MFRRIIQIFLIVVLELLYSGCSLVSSATPVGSVLPSATVANSGSSTAVASEPQHTPIVLGRLDNPTATRRAATQPRATAQRPAATPRGTPGTRATPLSNVPPAAPPIAGFRTVTPDELPREARQTLALIVKGGPFPYRQDGVVFQNRERRLPRQSNGYYHEYTVVTPGEGDRGARRIITGSNGEFFYTDDHYNSFVQVLPS